MVVDSQNTYSAKLCYISSAVNQGPHCLDWLNDGLACYASNCGLIVFDPKKGEICGVAETSHNHQIYSTRWVRPNPSSGPQVLSTSADHTAILWTWDQAEDQDVLKLHVKLEGHSGIVTIGDATVIQEDEEECILVATTSIDSSIKIWLVDSKGCGTCNQTISLGHGFALDLKFLSVPGVRYPILVYGGEDCKVHILVADDDMGYNESLALPGHEDWVRALDFTTLDSGDVLLASGSQDNLIRIWRFSFEKEEINTENELIDDGELKLKDIRFTLSSEGQSKEVILNLEAVLHGHEGWVYGLHWSTSNAKDVGLDEPLCLLSSSLDKTLILWEAVEDDDGVWLEKARLGDVGGNSLGFYGCCFSPDRRSVIGYGYQGGIYCWHKERDSWCPGVVVGGHFGEVVDIAWDLQGRYLLSASVDQTTRLHGPWVTKEGKRVWHELARPQVHGYDLACLAVLGPYKFASGAEEKVVRAFEAPANFIRNFGNLCLHDVQEDLEKCEVGEGALVPSLGLSNKAVDGKEVPEEEDNQIEDQPYFTPLDLNAPATEDQLMQKTLWVEMCKLYGHVHPLFAMAATHDGSLLASSARAAQAVHANVILWDSKTWRQIDSLSSHQLTVTQLAFSPDDQYLLSVSRDRTWTIYKKKSRVPTSESSLDFTYAKMQNSDKKTGVHTRIIWSCAWFPNSKYFITASRDKQLVVWKLEGDERWVKEAVTTENDAVTAVSVAKVSEAPMEDAYLIATGLESGIINLKSYRPSNTSEPWGTTQQVNPCHRKTVRRLCFHYCEVEDQQSGLHLASCSNDHAVHIYRI
ncbi:elongator complex protein 2 [Oratosquilla oratoria]|uniref:elongator complex protein 2 n=1 Tax=Oratosquilla oratoria TaxID=337810 RepID=UPI003F75E2B6